MIIFEKVRWKNFLSTGNAFNEIDIIENSNTLIVGNNGSGKSTILDALSFGLFGKAYRDINKPQLVNTINKKDCVVEVEFSVGPNSFKVVRGIKPNIFKIFRNGECINESSHATEYQKILEQNILKLNHKSFNQIVVLGSASFTPFMKLTTGQRREVIEDLLDINVFSKMNSIVKENMSDIKSQIGDKSTELEIVKNQISVQRKYINDLQNLSEQLLDDNQKAIESLTKDNVKRKKLIANLNEELSEYDGIGDRISSAHEKMIKLAEEKKQLKLSVKKLVSESKFINENSVCPTCTQEIDSTFKQTKTEAIAEEAEKVKNSLEKVDKRYNKQADAYNLYNLQNNDAAILADDLRQENFDFQRAKEDIEKLQKQNQEIQSNNGNITEANKELSEQIDVKDTLLTEKAALDEELAYHKAVSDMLKDTGIKTQIIKQYIPVMNKYINQYLQTLDFFVHFELTETFQEVIRSRHRDTFSYPSFSEGEKQRIDLALLFTWRKIARMKNSVATNLLILDETFDSSLDNDGIENLFKIIYTLGEDTNVVVISHKGEILDNRFKKKLTFVRNKNFSKIIA